MLQTKSLPSKAGCQTVEYLRYAQEDGPNLSWPPFIVCMTSRVFLNVTEHLEHLNAQVGAGIQISSSERWNFSHLLTPTPSNLSPILPTSILSHFSNSNALPVKMHLTNTTWKTLGSKKNKTWRKTQTNPLKKKIGPECIFGEILIVVTVEFYSCGSISLEHTMTNYCLVLLKFTAKVSCKKKVIKNNEKPALLKLQFNELCG